MTQEELNTMITKAGVKIASIPQNLAEMMCNYGITDKEDARRFLANCLNETGGFARFRENLYYTTPARLVQVFPSAFRSKYNPASYVRNPEKLANLVYDDRKFPKGLGNNQDGDGWKYIGRGAIQLTGRANYTLLAKDTGLDFVSKPEMLEEMPYKFLSALNFWRKHKLSEKTSLLATRQVVAGNYTVKPFGYEEVTKWYNKLK